MKKILAIVMMLAFLFTAGEPVNGKYDGRWFFGEGMAIAVIALCARALDEPDPKPETENAEETE